MARFLVDESLPPQIAEALRTSGHDAVDARDVGLAGADDAGIYQAASARNAIVISLDLDFSDARLFPEDTSIVVFRFRRSMQLEQLGRLCLTLLNRFMSEIERLDREIMILERGRSRISPKL